MPFYEYKAKENGCDHCRLVFCEMQGINDLPLTHCPMCNTEICKLVSQVGGIIIGGRQANQYNDCKGAKYWRDKNGVRHRVTEADGHSNAPTSTSKQYNSPEQIKALKAADKAKSAKQRQQQSYNRYVQEVKNSKRK